MTIAVLPQCKLICQMWSILHVCWMKSEPRLRPGYIQLNKASTKLNGLQSNYGSTILRSVSKIEKNNY